MGIIIRQSFWNAVISYAGILLGFLLSIVLYPHILTPDQYGLTRVLFSASFISTQVALLGFQNLIIRYYPLFDKASPGRHGLLFWVLIVPVFGFVLFCLIYLGFGNTIISFYGDQSPLFVEYYWWVVPLTLFYLYYEVLNNYLRSLKDTITGSFTMEILQRVLTIFFLVAYFFGWLDFSSFVMLFVGSYLVNPVVIAIQIARRGEWRLKPDFNILRRPLLKGMANYSAFSMLGGITTVIVWNVDILMLGSMAGLDQTAIYAIAFYLASVIAIPQRSIEKIVSPMIAGFIKEKNWQEVGEIYRKTSINQLIPGILIFGVIWLLLDLVYLFMPDIYAAGKGVVLIIGIGKLVEMATSVNGLILLNSRHYRVSFYTNIVLVVVAVGANYLLIPQYGITGAAVASVLALVLYNGTKYIYILVTLKLQPFTRATFLVTALGVGALILAELLVITDNIWVNSFVQISLFTVVFAGVVIYFKLSEELNSLITNGVATWKR